MEFTCQTIYHQKSLTILTRALRKTIRRKTSRQMRIISWGIMVIELVCLLSSLHTRWLAVGNGLVVVSLLLLLWKEDAFNAFFAKRKQLPGTDTCTTVFYPDHYETCIAGACTQWQYSRVLALAESKDYFVFILGRNHAQAYDKRKLAGGSADVFRRFIEEKTGKTVQNIGG
mgnify:FL=1